MKKCIIIHGCPSTNTDVSYNKHRIPWTKQTLQNLGIETFTPAMPHPRSPIYEDHKKTFEKNIPFIDNDTILIGHSCGAAFLVRRLSEHPVNIKQLILVAPRKINDEGDSSKENFYEYEIDSELRTRIASIIMFTADNEDQEGKESLEIFHKSLGGTIINIPTYGHYTFGDMETEEFPELINSISKI